MQRYFDDGTSSSKNVFSGLNLLGTLTLSPLYTGAYLLKPDPAAFAIRLFVTFGKANYGMRTGKPQCLRLFSEKNCFDLFY